MSTAMRAAIAGDALAPVYLIELRFDTGTQYRTTSQTEITWNGNTYTRGNIVGVPSISESYELKIPSLSLTLSGIAQANVTTALLEDSVDREVVIYLGLIDASFALVVDPVEVFKGRITGWSYRDGADSAAVEWDIASHFADFERVAGRRTNDEDQQLLFAGDKGLEFAARSDSTISWGRS